MEYRLWFLIYHLENGIIIDYGLLVATYLNTKQFSFTRAKETFPEAFSGWAQTKVLAFQSRIYWLSNTFTDPQKILLASEVF